MHFTQHFEISGNEKRYNYPLAFYLSAVSISRERKDGVEKHSRWG